MLQYTVLKYSSYSLSDGRELYGHNTVTEQPSLSLRLNWSFPSHWVRSLIWQGARQNRTLQVQFILTGLGLGKGHASPATSSCCGRRPNHFDSHYHLSLQKGQWSWPQPQAGVLARDQALAILAAASASLSLVVTELLV